MSLQPNLLHPVSHSTRALFQLSDFFNLMDSTQFSTVLRLCILRACIYKTMGSASREATELASAFPVGTRTVRHPFLALLDTKLLSLPAVSGCQPLLSWNCPCEQIATLAQVLIHMAISH